MGESQTIEEWWARGMGMVRKTVNASQEYKLRSASFVSRPQITSQPQGRTNSLGTTASFSVQAIGTDPLSYQWRMNGTNLASGGTRSGTTSSNLTIANFQMSDVGGYSIVVTNAYGSVTSSVAVLNMQLPTPTILTADGGLGLSGGKFGFNLNGPAGLVVIIEASSDLANWLPIQTNALINGQVRFTDPQAALFPKRFYRARFAFASSPQLLLQFSPGISGFISNQFGFNLSGTGGQTVVIEASTNLTAWTPLLTNSLLTGYYYFNDPGSTNFPQRFYRAIRRP
jgi:hypothetical protein